MRVLFFSLMVVFFCFVGSYSAFANVRAYVQRLAESSDAIQTLYATFIQEKRMEVLTRPMQSSGYFCFRAKKQNPENASLLWMYTKPMAMGFLYANKHGALIDLTKDSQHITKANRAEESVIRTVVDQMLSLIVLKPAQLEKTSVLRISENDPATLIIEPKRPGFFTKLAVTFAEKKAQIAKLVFFEKNGDTLTITFPKTVINKDLPDFCTRFF